MAQPLMKSAAFAQWAGPETETPCCAHVQVSLAISAGVPVPGFSASLSYFDTYRRDRLPANLVQVGVQ